MVQIETETLFEILDTLKDIEIQLKLLRETKHQGNKT